jgi:hypothetical protein
MIETLIEKWHRHLRGELPGGLDELLADDVVFYSPVVFTPQKGKDVTKLYLGAAGNTFSGGEQGSSFEDATDRGFRYTKEIVGPGPHAMLEFETEIDGIVVNGVDILTCNAEGKISEFKVLIRPLKAVNLMHEQMRAMLEKMQGRES